MANRSVTTRQNEKRSGWGGEEWKSRRVNSCESCVYPTSLLVVVLGAPSTDPALATDESFPVHQNHRSEG